LAGASVYVVADDLCPGSIFFLYLWLVFCIIEERGLFRWNDNVIYPDDWYSGWNGLGNCVCPQTSYGILPNNQTKVRFIGSSFSSLANGYVSSTLMYLFFLLLYRMKDKGYEVSGKGVSIKTSKRFDRQDYIDATQRYVRVLVDINLLLLCFGIDICVSIEYRNMMKTMNATSFNRRPDSNPSTQGNAFAGPVMADRLSGKTSGNGGDKKSVSGGLRKNTV